MVAFARVKQTLQDGGLTEVAGNFITEHAAAAVHLANHVAHLGACQHYLLRLLADKVAGHPPSRRQAHKQINVVIEGDLSGRRGKNVD